MEHSRDSVELRPLMPEKAIATDCEVACMVGVKSRELYDMHRRAGMHLIYLDKGYTRGRAQGVRTWEYWRVAVDGHHPTHYFDRIRGNPDRADELDLKLNPWRMTGEHIVIAGSSAKYHEFYGLRDPTQYAMKIVKRLRQYTSRPIVYRPKPSWREATPIEGTTFSKGGSILEVLDNAWALVTHGSNACFEAVLHGIPCIILGEAVAKPISSTTLDAIEDPRLATHGERSQWLSNLAYCQFSMAEFADGTAWKHIRPLIYG